MISLRITPHDPVIARDGRPFNAGAGNRMRPLPFLYPSVLAGSLRTYLGKAVDPLFPPAVVNQLRATSVHGPLLADAQQLYLPRPADVLFSPDASSLHRLLPTEIGDDCGTDLPAIAGLPVMPHPPPDDNFKPGPVPAFWSLKNYTDWLTTCSLTTLPGPKPDEYAGRGYLRSLAHDVRWHVQIKADTYAAQDQRLFLTAGLALPPDMGFIARFDSEVSPAFIPGFSPLGGERRLAWWESGGDELWACPSAVAQSVRSAKRIRLILATPGLFRGGWLPGWLENEEPIPGTNVRVRLRGACIDRWRAVSGYSLDRSQGKRRYGRKPIRRLVAAGAVYFLERIDHDTNESFPVESVWLKPVSDLGQGEDVHRGAADGYGLALWGTW